MMSLEPARLVPTFLLMSRRAGNGSGKREDPLSLPCGRAIRRVAVVEDELIVAWAIESMLEDLGHEVVGIFANGEDAIVALEDVAVDLICMDINLGCGIDGIEAARRIRERQRTSILFISAYSDDLTRMRITEILPDAVLTGKPTSLATLKQAIGNFTRPVN